jgi:hypothetical protein
LCAEFVHLGTEFADRHVLRVHEIAERDVLCARTLHLGL